MERLFDINLRVRRPAFNIAVFYMILVGFFDSLLISRFASSMVSIVLLYLFQPFLVFGVPVLFLKLHEKKYSQAFARSAYTPPKARKRDIVLVALTALTAWLFYTYSIYAAEGFRAAATGGLSLYIPPRPSLWQLFLSLVVNAVFAAGLREYAFRYLGRKAYGRTIWGIAFASLLSAFVSYDLLIAIRLFILGVGSAAIFCGTKRMRFCFIFAFVFEGLQTIVPSYWILPLSTYAAVSHRNICTVRTFQRSRGAHFRGGTLLAVPIGALSARERHFSFQTLCGFDFCALSRGIRSAYDLE